MYPQRTDAYTDTDTDTDTVFGTLPRTASQSAHLNRLTAGDFDALAVDPTVVRA